jgi:hypothetical protein
MSYGRQQDSGDASKPVDSDIRQLLAVLRDKQLRENDPTQVNRRGQTASNFSCPNCCQVEPSQWTFSPSPFAGPVSGAQQMTVYEWDGICGCCLSGPYAASGITGYSSDASSIASVSSSGMVSFLSAGNTMIRVYITYWHSDYISAEDCGWFPVNTEADCPATAQVPSKIRFLDFPPRAPNGKGPVIEVSDGDVLDTAGNVLLHHQCGAYRNLAYEVIDQNGDPFDVPYSITESFTDYQGPSETPASFTRSISSNAVGDTQYLGKTYPACLGSDEHESFKQHVTVTYNQTQYPLSTVVSISRGRFAGQYKVDVDITTP